LIGQDTFYIGCLKGIGRIYPQVACDCFSSFGAAKVYDNKTTKVSTDFVENHLAKKFAPVKIEESLPIVEQSIPPGTRKQYQITNLRRHATELGYSTPLPR